MQSASASPEIVKEEPSEGSVFSDADAGPPKKRKRREQESLGVPDATAEGGRAKRRASSTVLDATKPATRPRISLAVQTPETVKSQGLQVWNAVNDYEHEGRLLSPIFAQKPSKKLYPDYYQLIKRPIALDEIKNKLNKQAYTSLDDLQEDFDLMFSNAKQYNAPGSVIYEDAERLHDLVLTRIASLNAGAAGAKTKDLPTMKSWLNQKLEDVTYWQDASGRYLSEVFMALPDRELYPDYYEHIPQPMSFDIVQDKVNKRMYPTEKNFIQDVKGIFANAKYYNEERSQIWKDATQLERVFIDMMKEPPPNFAALVAERDKSPVSGGTPKITLKLGGNKSSAPEQPKLPKVEPKRERSEVPVVMEQPVTPAMAPAPAAPAQMFLPDPGPRIVRERVLAGTGGKPCLTSIIVRCRPVGPMTELSTAEYRQHALVIPRATETIEIVPVGTLNVRPVSRPMIQINHTHDTSTSQVVYLTRPPPAQVLTTVELFARANDGSTAEQVYRLFLQRLPM